MTRAIYISSVKRPDFSDKLNSWCKAVCRFPKHYFIISKFISLYPRLSLTFKEEKVFFNQFVLKKFSSYTHLLKFPEEGLVLFASFGIISAKNLLKCFSIDFVFVTIFLSKWVLLKNICQQDFFFYSFSDYRSFHCNIVSTYGNQIRKMKFFARFFTCSNSSL